MLLATPVVAVVVVVVAVAVVAVVVVVVVMMMTVVGFDIADLALPSSGQSAAALAAQ